MSVILVAEQDAGHVRRIVNALRSAGWTPRTVDSRAAALRSAAVERPSLLLASSLLPEAEKLLSAFSRSRGGPGSIVLVPERTAVRVSAADYQADDMVTMPCPDELLTKTVHQCLSLPALEAPRPKPMARQLTSEEIFGDVLAEVEAEAERAKRARLKRSRSTGDDEIERRLEETLSGVLSADDLRKRSKRKAAGKTADDRAEIDRLLDETLSSLEPPAPPVPAAAAVDVEPKPDVPEAVDERPPRPPRLEPWQPLEPLSIETREEPRPPDVHVDQVLGSEPPPTAAFDVPPPPPAMTVEPPPEAGSVPERRQTQRRTADRRTAPPPGAPELGRPDPDRPDDGVDLRQADAIERGGEIFRTQPFPIATATPDRGAPEPEPSDRAEGVAEEPADSNAFGDYTLLDRIAVGGMAEVWRARRRGVEGFRKTVAIKKILSHLTDSSDFVTMLIDEAKLAAQLSHHNIIQIYDLGKLGDDFFIAMEYVDGKDLRSILEVARDKGSPLPLGLALLIVDAVARALDYAHRKRDFEGRELELVHRDISPQNVLISYEGEIKLCDFGIVKAVSKASTTQMGALKGKLQYMSPEQAWGRPVDARSDIFSLGSVFFELLTGVKLFTGESEISVLDAVRECRPRSPREIVPAIPKEVESIVLRALAENPEERYQRAGDMEHDIKSVLDLIKPTPRLKDLAAYMEALFHRAGPLTSSPAAGPAAAAAGTGAEAVAEARPATDASQAVDAPPPPPKTAGAGKRVAQLLAAAVLVGVLAGAGYFFLREPLSSFRATAPAPDATESAPAPPAHAVAEEEAAAAAAAIPADSADADAEPGAADPTVAEPTDAAADTGDPSALPVDLEQLVAEEVSRRRQEIARDFEERKRRLEEEIEKAERDSQEDPDEGGGR